MPYVQVPRPEVTGSILIASSDTGDRKHCSMVFTASISGLIFSLLIFQRAETCCISPIRRS